MTRERYNEIMNNTPSYYRSNEVSDEEREFILKYFFTEPEKFDNE